MKGFIEVCLGYKTQDKCLINLDNIDVVFQHKDKKILHHDKKYIIETNSWIELKRKMASIHSFKGWESPALFLVIEDSIKSSSVLNNRLQPVEFSDELVYTGLTRCQNYLFIINLGNQLYHDYFWNSFLIDKRIGNNIAVGTK